MIGWYHGFNGREFEQTQGDRKGQGSLACCSSWGHKKSNTTEQLNNNTLRKQVRSLGQEDPLEEGMAAHSSILAWRVPLTEEPGRIQVTGLKRVRHNLNDLARTHAHVEKVKVSTNC